MNRLVLASRSAARARLLAEAGVAVELDPADLDEAALTTVLLAASSPPAEIAQTLAAKKALAVSRRRSGLVIGADQTLELGGELFNKPTSVAQARDQLLRLRGRAHQLHAAVALAEGDTVAWRTVQSAILHVRAFSSAFLDAYIAREGEVLLGCVGAYRLEGVGAQLFERVEGDYFTVLGLPLLPLLGRLRGMGEVAA